MTRPPGPRVLTDEALSELLGARHFSVLATNRRDGHPHLTTMVHGWDPQTRTVRFFTTADRVKAGHLRRDPRAAVHVQGDDVWSFAVAEGEAEVSEATAVPGDAVGREVLAMLPEPMRPAPEDERAFLERLVEERRVVIRLRVRRLYGTALDVDG
ncbi:pyridoxamine 5'-phosphate oxidase family protein [Streptomyces nanshensis]|uniref:Pyridoxamine 5'-phosphate oxidase n=1 Tax=Streptomyces nanshensis TaxID=518642 RepID=A0A1E7L3W0_9ACTN|nr:TIGR03618 family F420-dependent PPOX class oxidoreductase [Streptomyces nanshensis]OEV10896.1 pyridoxamine 5'-phosphate oxidase [Streptomyces nanshensis]